MRKHYNMSGDIINMYCKDTKNPIFYNSIFDPTTGILHCAGVGNNKDFI